MLPILRRTQIRAKKKGGSFATPLSTFYLMNSTSNLCVSFCFLRCFFDDTKVRRYLGLRQDSLERVVPRWIFYKKSIFLI